MSRENLYVVYMTNGTKELVEGPTIFEAISRKNINSLNISFFSDVGNEDWIVKNGEWVREPDPEFRAIVEAHRLNRREARRNFEQDTEEAA